MFDRGVVRVGDSYEALVVVRHERIRPPTGLSAFPDGGRALIEMQTVIVISAGLR